MKILLTMLLTCTCAIGLQAKDLLDQSFTLHEDAAEDAEAVGAYALAAKEVDGMITITESLEIKTRKGKIGFSSTVAYKQGKDKSWVFASAKGSTRMEGKAVMEVKVTPNADKWQIDKKMFVGRDGGRLEDPAQSRRAIDAPKGDVLFMSARAVIGPRMQTAEGQRPITWVEFPDDLDEAITIKEGFSISRSEADKQGGYTLMVINKDRAIDSVPLDREGNIKPHWMWSKYPMRKKAEE